MSKKDNNKAAQKSKKELQKELEARKDNLEHTEAEMGAELSNLIADDISKTEKKEKTRSKEILAVFAKHNFFANGITPEELRTTLEDLGPTYVKIGQIMSSRVDMLPESYCNELKKLRQNVKQLDPNVARAVIEQESGKKIEELFSEFKDEPLGSASIGQVHYGVLKDGTKVVAKVQRPLIADMMRKDFVILKNLASKLNKAKKGDGDKDGGVDLYAVIDEMAKVTEEELDFRVEAETTRFFKENCIEDEEKITCPTVIDELTTERIFTMTYVDGYSISKRERFIEEGYDVNEVGTIIVDNYLHQVLDVGTFHADPHQGNIMLSHGKPVWIDFGMVGRITEADVTNIQNLVLGIINFDLEDMVSAVCAMGASSPKTDRGKLVDDLDNLLSAVRSVTNLEELDMAGLLNDVMDVMDNNHITIPGKYTMLVRSIATIEGVLEEFCPELSLFELLTNRLLERAKKSFDLKQTMSSGGKEFISMSKKTVRIPPLTADALSTFVKGRTKLNVELTGYDELIKNGRVTLKNLVLAFFACVLFFGSCILATADIEPKTHNGMPILAVFGIVCSIALAIYTIRKFSKK